MRNVLSKEEVDKLYSKMREKGVSASQICKVLNIHYQCFRAMALGKQPCYGKWRKVIADMLQTDKAEIFVEDI